MSIHPKFAHQILDGSKLYEYRKVIPKCNDIGKVYIYASKPIKRIVGEFIIESIICDSPRMVWATTHEQGGISKEYFDAYFNGRDKAYAIKVGTVTKYDKPIDPKEIITDFTAPQNFRYTTIEL